MKVSDKQVIIMFDVLKYSTAFVGGLAGYSRETLNGLVNEIIHQQDETPTERTEPGDKDAD